MTEADITAETPDALRARAIQTALDLIDENQSFSNILVEGIQRILGSAHRQASELEAPTHHLSS
jgi:hypothetical protein